MPNPGSVDINALAANLLRRNPNVANSPMGQQFLKILQTGDSAAGMAMAQNLCTSMGVTPEKAVEMAKRSFNLPF